MNAPARRVVAAGLIALIAITASGCGSKPDTKSAEKPAANAATDTPSTEATARVATESTATTEPTATPPPTAVPTATTPAPVPAPTPKPATPAPKPKPKLGPTDAAKSWAYLKDMYNKNGYWYVVVDYITVEGPEESLHFVNENPRLRTFPLSEGAKLYLLKSPGSPDYKLVTVAQFATFEAGSGDEVVEVTPKAGYAIKLKEWWAP